MDVSEVLLSTVPLLDDHIGYENDIEFRTFTGFRMLKPGSPEVLSPQWEFAVPPDILSTGSSDRLCGCNTYLVV